jgi:hypothetical protein
VAQTLMLATMMVVPAGMHAPAKAHLLSLQLCQGRQ